MTGSCPTASIANTFDRPNPSSLATSPAFSNSGSMACPPSSALDFSRSTSQGKTPGVCEIGRRSPPAAEGVASYEDHPRHRLEEPRVLAGVAASPSSPRHLLKGPFWGRFRRMSFDRA
jgi:hypothetical protein